MLYEYCLNFFKVGGKKMLLEHLKGQERWGSIKLSVEEVRKSKICHPRRCHFTMWIIWSWRQSPADPGRTFYLSLNCLKGLRHETCTRKRATTRESLFISESLISMAWQTFVYQTLALLIFLWMIFEAPDLYPRLLSSGWYISIKYPTAKESHIFMGLRYVQNFLFFH